MCIEAKTASMNSPGGSGMERREFLYGLGVSLGGIAFSSLLADDTASGGEAEPARARAGHLPAKAKNCIFLMMEGGPSHIDTFDPKPKLKDLHLKEFVREGKQKSAMESGKRYYVQSPFKFRKAGQSGADMAENWQHLAKVADELCFFRGCQVDSVNHPTAMYQMNCGNRFGGDPGIGAWVTYGLGSVNQDLPGFLVLPEVSYPQGGAANWSNGYLPAFYQGTPVAPDRISHSGSRAARRRHRRASTPEPGPAGRHEPTTCGRTSRPSRVIRSAGKLRVGVPHADRSARCDRAVRREPENACRCTASATPPPTPSDANVC